uniref:protein naked cuticle homolog 1-like n=1 Tax=Styela clava TaxID=7725 RepID=UPI0019392E75|nr:protein naked cuticle homolog 1-like [Styela clava]
MGAKHSKPRIRRGQRFPSVRKRQAPEGSNDPPTITSETWKNGNNKIGSGFHDTTHDNQEKCLYCGITEKHCNESDQREICHKANGNAIESRCGFSSYPTEKSLFHNKFMHQTNLKVDLPNTPARYRSCDGAEKCKSLPSKVPSGLQENTNQMTKDEEDEWTITLYEIDKMSGRVPREDMVRLMSSIYDAVDNKVGESPQGRKTVRVRLSVTPERQSQSKLHRTSSNPNKAKTDCRCQDCPKTEPSNRKISNDSRVRRHRSDVSATQLKTGQINQYHDKIKEISRSRERSFREHQNHHPIHSSEKLEREKLYSKLNGLNQNSFNENSDSAEIKKGLGNKDSCGTRHKTLPDVGQINQDKLNSKSRDRRLRCHGNDPRSAMLKNRRKDPRFASPYDQHFQEAMYLRLKELQRQGAHEMCRATGRRRDSDEADDDSSSDSGNEFTKSNIESNNKTVIRHDTTESPTSCKNNMTETDSQSNNLQEASTAIASSVSNIYHHHHYHHGISGESVLAAICSSDSSPVSKHVTNSSSPESKGKGEQHFHHYHHHYHHADKS